MKLINTNCQKKLETLPLHKQDINQIKSKYSPSFK